MAQFDIVENTVLSEKIAEQILALIKAKQLRPGDRLPSERELAVQMKVSRPSLREALRALSLLHIVEIRPGSGTYVSSLKPELLVDQLDVIFAIEDSTFFDLIEARIMIEVDAAGLAAKRATPAELHALQAYHIECVQHKNEYIEFLNMDIELHRMIARCSHNPIIDRFVDVMARMNSARRRQHAYRLVAIETTITEHQTIIDALMTRNEQAVRAAMLTHLNNGKERLLGVLSAEPAEPGSN